MEQLLTGDGIRRPIPLRVTVNFGPALCLTPSGYRLLVPEATVDVTDGFAAQSDPGARNGPLAARRRLEIVFGPLVGLAALV